MATVALLALMLARKVFSLFAILVLSVEQVEVSHRLVDIHTTHSRLLEHLQHKERTWLGMQK